MVGAGKDTGQAAGEEQHVAPASKVKPKHVPSMYCTYISHSIYVTT